MTGKTVGNDGTRRPVRRLAWGNAGRRRSRVSVAGARRPLAFAIVQAMVGAVLVAGLSVASPVASAATSTAPPADADDTTPTDDGTQDVDTGPADASGDESGQEASADAATDDEASDDPATEDDSVENEPASETPDEENSGERTSNEAPDETGAANSADGEVETDTEEPPAPEDTESDELAPNPDERRAQGGEQQSAGDIGLLASVACTPDPGYDTCVAYTYEGVDQLFTVPDGVTDILVKTWGAGGGGSIQEANNVGAPGGSGGYVQGELAVTPGTEYAVVVGEGGGADGTVGTSTACEPAYGFGGACAPPRAPNPNYVDGGGGGGLSGLFTGSAPVTETDQARAVLVAGGGGAGEGTTSCDLMSAAGGAGGNTFAGTMPTMQGVHGAFDPVPIGADPTGGGGGYFGGDGTDRLRNGTCVFSANGGSSFIDAAVTNPINEAGTEAATVPAFTANTPPRTAEAQYQAGVGVGEVTLNVPGGNGLVVIQYNDPPPPPFECTSTAYLFQQVPTDVWEGDLVTGDFGEVASEIEDTHINGIGYNPIDNYIYGWSNSAAPGGTSYPAGLVRVGSDYSVEYLGIPDPLTEDTLIGHGDVDSEGHYWARVTSVSPNQWVQIDLSDPDAPTFGEVLNSGDLSVPAGFTLNPDWSFNPADGFIYGTATGPTGATHLMRFDRANPNQVMSDEGQLAGVPAGGFGATYMDADGFMYISNNASGDIYRINIADVTASFFVQGPGNTGQNDGARCTTPIYTDYGDAPDSYGTTLADDGPRHGIPGYDPDNNAAPLMLGELIDIESDGIPGADADGDDGDNVADEDGVAAQIVMADGQETTVSVSATNDTNEDAILAGWIDLDGNGTFDPGELVTETVPAGSGLDSYDLTFPVGTVDADTYARFRLFPGDVDPADILPTGPASAGEVEDYTVTFLALEVDKTSDATEDSRAGDTVTYEVTLTNSGTSDYTAANPARYRDDLTDVLDDATLDEGSLSADQPGTLDFTDPFISWEGALAADESVVITYEVVLTGDGDGLVRNVAFVPPCDPADPDCDPVTPECDPPDDGRDPQTGLPCAETEFELPRLEIDKTADATELPAVGETVTYTVVATNVGPGDYTSTAPAPVTDDLTEVLDDATFDEASLSADRPGTLDFTDPIVTWEGALPAGESVTLEYTVTYTGEGDQILTNEACVPEDEVAPGAEPCDSIEIPGAFIVDEKSVEASDEPVLAGTVLTYTLTFENEGEAAGTVDKVDDLTHVLDDGDVTAGPTTSDAALTATGPGADNRISITGTLAAGQVVTVTYEVTVKPDGERGDNIAANFLLPPIEPPLCDPADPDCDPPPCEEGDEDCTVTRIPEIDSSKAVEASDDPVVAGTVLTYTLTFENEGEAAGEVDEVDDLTHVLDDGDVTAGPTTSDAALTASGPGADNRIGITGTLAAGQVVTVTYEVTVKPDGERGDNVAANFLLPPIEPPLCDPADPDCDPPPCEEDDPKCTETPVGEIVDSKSVDPESGTTVVAGETLTYTLTFENVGEAPAPVDHDDVVSGILDDADITAGPTASDPALTVSGPSDGRINVAGTLDAGDLVTVTYEVQVKPDGERGDNLLGNFLVKEGVVPPEECEEDDPSCTENPVPEIVDWKEVDPVSTTPVTAGEELTYTLTFTNEGEAAGDVDRVDDLSHTLDDADLISGPTASDAALTVSGPDGDGRISIIGSLDADQTVTITYTVLVRESGERGDDVLANFLLDPDKEPPPEPECEPADDEKPDCTYNPVGEIKPSKSVDPESGTEVAAGEELTYTVTFTNVGQGADDVDYTDHAADVFDDAELIDGPTVSDAALTASGPDGDGRIHITGSLDGGETATVTYTVRVKDHDQQGDNHLGNFVTMTGEEPPEECLDTNPLCTENPIEPPPPDKSGPLPITGVSLGTSSLVGLGLAMLLAGLVLVAATRRNRELATGERSVMLNELF